jgi:hypothetical protein
MHRATVKIVFGVLLFYGSETWTLGKNEEKIINAFETWSWRIMLKIKQTDRIMNDEVYQRAKKKNTFKIKKKYTPFMDRA